MSQRTLKTKVRLPCLPRPRSRAGLLLYSAAATLYRSTFHDSRTVNKRTPDTLIKSRPACYIDGMRTKTKQCDHPTTNTCGCRFLCALHGIQKSECATCYPTPAEYADALASLRQFGVKV